MHYYSWYFSWSQKIYSIECENRIGVQLEKQYNTANSIQMRS